MIKDYFLLGIRNIRKRKLRSWLTMIGIIISIATIFMLISISIGLQEAVEEQFRILGTDKFFIQPRGSVAGPGTAAANSLTIKDVEAIEKVSGVKTTSYFKAANAEVVLGKEKRFLMIAAIPGDRAQVFEELESYKADEGKMIDYKKTGDIMVGSQFKYNALYKKPVRAGDRLEINGKEFKVSAVLQPIGNPSDDRLIYMSMDDFDILFPKETDIDQIFVQIQEGADINEVVDKVRKRLFSVRDVTEKTRDFTILTPQEILSSAGNVLNIITAFLFGVAAISLLVGGIGIANTMYTSVLERTREIGTMKAVGAKNSDILLIFLIESGMIGLTGGILGVLLGAGVSYIIEFIAVTQLATTLLQAAYPWYLIFGCLAFAFLSGAIAGIWPAHRASKLKAVDALRYE